MCEWKDFTFITDMKKRGKGEEGGGGGCKQIDFYHRHAWRHHHNPLRNDQNHGTVPDFKREGPKGGGGGEGEGGLQMINRLETGKTCC